MRRLKQNAVSAGVLVALVVAVGAALVAPARAAKPEVDKLSPTVVRDLHFGDALFYYYQGKDLEAITRLMAYQQWGRMPHHDAETNLLLGGLYLSLGLHNEAGDRFDRERAEPKYGGQVDEHIDPEPEQRHHVAHAVVVALLEELRHGIDLILEVDRHKEDRYDHKRSGCHPLVGCNGETHLEA